MTLDLTCQACDTSFELEAAELLDEPRLQCPSCEARVPRAAAEALSGALEELFSQFSRLQPTFQLIAEVSSEDLPPPYDRERATADDDAEEEDVDDAEGKLERDDED
jgi:hypothetical protein